MKKTLKAGGCFGLTSTTFPRIPEQLSVAEEESMKRTDFEGMCELAQEGRLTWVENMDSHEKGRVVSCSGETIEVETSGHRETWSLRDCKELTYGYKVNYEEVKRHPHEFDTHLD
jgi:hypothetical protein